MGGNDGEGAGGSGSEDVERVSPTGSRLAAAGTGVDEDAEPEEAAIGSGEAFFFRPPERKRHPDDRNRQDR